jgi:hypothetical protein
LHNEELHNSYSSPNIIRTIVKEHAMGGVYSAHGVEQYCIHVFGGKARRKRPLGRPRFKWEDDIKMDVTEIGWGGRDWIDLALDRDQWRALANTVMNLQFPYIFGMYFSS